MTARESTRGRESAAPAAPQQHTPEPWRVVPRPAADHSVVIESTERVNVAFVPAKTQADGLPTAAPNAARIVACVNSCAGLDPAAIPALIEAAERMPAACSSLMDELTGKQATDWGLVNDALCGLRAALAAVRGRA